MSGIIANNEPRLFKPSRPVSLVKAGPFILAMLCAPVVTAVFTFWILLIPVFAIPFGLPLYLVMGVPCFMWALSYHNWPPIAFAVLGFAMNGAAFLAVSALSFGPLGEAIDQEFAYFYFGFGAFHAPVWAYAFARLYSDFSKD